MTLELGARILGYLKANCFGPSRATPRVDIMAHFALDFEDENVDRDFRAWYSQAGIACCERGIFIPRSPEDVADCRLHLWPKMSPDRVRARMERIYAAFPKCRPETGKQLELGI